MGPNNDFLTSGPAMPSRGSQVERVAFAPDYKYAEEAEIRKVTTDHLSKLEIELHTLRMVYVANGGNPDLLIGPNRKLGEEITKIEATIRELEEYFHAVLNDDDAHI